MTLPPISRPLLLFFRMVVRLFFRFHFTAVRLSAGQRLTAVAATSPLIVYSNHGSWWDPMVLFLLAETHLPQRPSYAPMDADSLATQPLLRRLGIFPVELHTARGARQFLRTGTAILADGGVLWVTPQGRFADPRERPLGLRAGLATLAARFPSGCTLVPLAIEYPFWNRRRPETLLHIGRPVQTAGLSPHDLEADLEAALLAAMAELESLALTRNPAAFPTTLLG